jgi:hypothetical protein
MLEDYPWNTPKTPGKKRKSLRTTGIVGFADSRATSRRNHVKRGRRFMRDG